jgi:predicted GTPase
MKELESLKKEFERLEIQIAVVREKLTALQVDQHNHHELRTGDSVVYCKTPKRVGEVYKVTKFRVGVVFENGELRFYKRKNLKKVERKNE